jgi:hypothetical protein
MSCAGSSTTSRPGKPHPQSTTQVIYERRYAGPAGCTTQLHGPPYLHRLCVLAIRVMAFASLIHPRLQAPLPMWKPSPRPRPRGRCPTRRGGPPSMRCASTSQISSQIRIQNPLLHLWLSPTSKAGGWAFVAVHAAPPNAAGQHAALLDAAHRVLAYSCAQIRAAAGPEVGGRAAGSVQRARCQPGTYS